MNIVIINKHIRDKIGGSEVQCDIIAKELTKLGHNVTYLAVLGVGVYDEAYQVIPVENDADAIALQCREINPDLVYWRYNTFGFRKTAQKLYQQGVPLVFGVSHIVDISKWKTRTIPGEKSFIKRFLIRTYRGFLSRWEYSGFRYVTGLVVNNREFLEKTAVKEQVYIPSSVEDRKGEFEWPRKYLFWVSSLKPSKRPELCLDLAEKLADEDVDIVMVGEIQKESYKWFANAENLPGNLHYLGPQPLDTVNGAISKSICLIHTCQPEGFPNNFMQAWCKGKPVVSIEYDPDSVIEQKKLGFVAKGEMDSFVRQVKTLIHDSDLRKEMGDNARKYVEEYHQPEKNVAKLESFFSEIVNRNKPRKNS